MRHVGVGIAYPLVPKILIGGLAVSHLLWYGLAIYGLIVGAEILWWLPLILFRLLLVGWNYAVRNVQPAGSEKPTAFNQFVRLPVILACVTFCCAFTTCLQLLLCCLEAATAVGNRRYFVSIAPLI